MPETILNFWQNQAKRGEKYSPVYMCVGLGRIQPRGYCYGWSTSKRAANKMVQDVMTRNGDHATVLKVS